MTTQFTVVIFAFISTLVHGQQNYFRQIFSDDINEQFFKTTKAIKIEQKCTLYDTLSGKIKKEYKVTTTFDTVTRLGKTYDASVKETRYWKTDSNGVNNCNYDKNGIFLDLGFYSTVSYKEGRPNIAYGRKISYDKNGRITKTTYENSYAKFYQDCYFNYQKDSIISRNVYMVEYKSGQNDTIVKTFVTKDFTMTTSTLGGRLCKSKTINSTENGADIEEQTINGKKYLRVETTLK